MSSKTTLICLRIFSMMGKNPSMEDLPGSLLHMTVVHNWFWRFWRRLKILSRGVNLCQRNAASIIMLESVEWFDLQHNFLFWTRPKHSLLQYGVKIPWFTSQWEKRNKGCESAEKRTKKYGQSENRVKEAEDCDPPSPPSPPSPT